MQERRALLPGSRKRNDQIRRQDGHEMPPESIYRCCDQLEKITGPIKKRAAQIANINGVSVTMDV